jgi:hypothetical protein
LKPLRGKKILHLKQNTKYVYTYYWRFLSGQFRLSIDVLAQNKKKIIDLHVNKCDLLYVFGYNVSDVMSVASTDANKSNLSKLD